MKWLTIFFCLLCSPCFAGVYYFAPASVVNTWADADAGNGVSSLISGKMNFTVSSAASGSYARRNVTGISYPNAYIIEIRCKFNTVGTVADVNTFAVSSFSSSTEYSPIYFASDGVFTRLAASTYVEVGIDAVTTGDYYTYRILIKRDTDIAYIWRNGIYLGSGSIAYTTWHGLPEGMLSLVQYGYTVKGDTDVEYARILTEDGQLIQTIIE